MKSHADSDRVKYRWFNSLVRCGIYSCIPEMESITRFRFLLYVYYLLNIMRDHIN